MITDFKKSTSETYFLRFDDSKCLWAEITINDQGSFNAQSDNGDFCYRWPKHGRKSFKHFIMNELVSDPHYFLKKVAEEDYYDSWKTERAWKKKVRELRYEREIPKDLAREMYGDIEDITSEVRTPDLAIDRMYNSSLGRVDDPTYTFEVDMDYPPGAWHFARVVMPAFAEILKKEVAAGDSEGER